MSFEPKEWQAIVGELGPEQDGYWFCQAILGPRDACYVLKIRELIRDHVHFGASVATDLFILATGEPRARECTKIGGLPFWSYGRQWPVSLSGDPLPFLAQFNLARSRDIVGDVPAELMLLFGHPDVHDGLAVEWETTRLSSRLVTYDDMPVASCTPAFHGARWRTVNYPEWKPLCDNWSEVELPDGTTVLDLGFAMELLGMQIGSSPFLPPGEPVARENERILCSLCSVRPSPNQRHPFLNRAGTLTETECREMAVDITDVPDVDQYDGFGVLCIIATDDGRVRWQLDNL